MADRGGAPPAADCRALGEFEIGGITTLLGFHRVLLEHPCFTEGATCHGIVESEELAERAERLSHMTTTVPAASDGAVLRASRQWRLDQHRWSRWRCELARRRRDRAAAGGHGGAKDAVVTPMQGTVLAVEVAEGDAVEAGQVICIVEAMKMENEIAAHSSGVVTELAVEPGQAVSRGQVLCVVVEPEA